jgi:hypothetical protein
MQGISIAPGGRIVAADSMFSVLEKSPNSLVHPISFFAVKVLDLSACIS